MNHHEPAAIQMEMSDELQPMLFEEVNQLPGKFRSVIVLCLLEGKSRREAALQLGVPDGTVGTWLARGKEMLAKRLTRRGVTMAELLVASLLLPSDASAAVPVSVLSSTLRMAGAISSAQATNLATIPANVVSLSNGVLRSMLLTNLKISAVCLCLITATSWGISAWYSHLMAVESDRSGVRWRQTIQQASHAEGEMRVEGTVTGAAWSPDGKTLATLVVQAERGNSDINGVTFIGVDTISTVQLWDSESRTLQRTLPEEKNTIYRSMAFSRDGKWAAVTAKRSGTIVEDVRLYNARSWELIKVNEFSGLLTLVDFTPDCKTLIYAGRGRKHLKPQDEGPRYSEVNLWDLETMQLKHTMWNELVRENDAGFVMTVALTPDSKTLIVGGDDAEGRITCWDLLSGKSSGTLDGHVRSVEGKEQTIWKMPLALSPDATTLVTGCNKDSKLKCWDMQTKKIRKVLSSNQGVVTSMAYSADGKLLVTAGGIDEGNATRGEVILWDGRSLELKRVIPCDTPGVPQVAFSPDGSQLSVVTLTQGQGKQTSQVKLYRTNVGKK
jgi:WD40 repeat protein